MIGDSIVSNFTKHCSYIWNNRFPIKSMNLGIPGDKVEHVWQRICDKGIPKNTKVAVIHVGTNNIKCDSVPNIVDAILGMCTSFHGIYCNT